MKIGIMTFHSASNHGAALQAYALQTYLQKMGHEPFFINYHMGRSFPIRLFQYIGRTPSSTMEKLNNQLRTRSFLRFQRTYLKVGETDYFDHIQLQKNPPSCDVYICGSDQVWNPNLIKLEKDENAFWLNFGNNTVRRVAYAASFGVYKIEEDLIKKYANYVKRFDFVSVREKEAVEIIRNLGKEKAIQAPDPTLLIDQKDYQRVYMGSMPTQADYLFSYHLRTSKSPFMPIEQINETVLNKLKFDKTYKAYSVSLLYNILHQRYISPSKWLAFLRQSRFVVTNSFHGTIFSLIYHRPFIVLLKKGTSAGMNSRITSLLDVVGLQHRAVVDYDRKAIEELCREDIDWNKTDTKLQEFKEVGYNFLARALK